MATTWSKSSSPATSAQPHPLASTSKISVDLPDPDTPVTADTQPSGNRTDTFFKLWRVAPRISTNRPFPRRTRSRTVCPFASQAPVTEAGFPLSSSRVPAAATVPPCRPAPGPRSMIWSAAAITSGSCSMTSTVFS